MNQSFRNTIGKKNSKGLNKFSILIIFNIKKYLSHIYLPNIQPDKNNNKIAPLRRSLNRGLPKITRVQI